MTCLKRYTATRGVNKHIFIREEFGRVCPFSGQKREDNNVSDAAVEVA